MKTSQFFLSDGGFYLVFRYVWFIYIFMADRLFFQDLVTDNTKMPKKMVAGFAIIARRLRLSSILWNFCGNKLFKNMLKKKKREYKLKIVTKMIIKRGDRKIFWKLFGKLNNSKNDSLFLNSISGEKWKNYFRGILNDKTRDIVYPPDNYIMGPLDGCITKDELSKASYILKPNKASGFDLLSNEMILWLIEVQPNLLLKFFNSIFDSNAKINQWSLSVINPIFKMDPNQNPIITGGYPYFRVLENYLLLSWTKD